MSSNVKMFEVLFGPVDTPLDEWEVQYTFKYDMDEGPCPSRYGGNMAPEMIQEIYVRQPNWDITYAAKVEKTEVTHRYMMRQVPVEQDYHKRAADNNWTIWLSQQEYNWSMPRLSDDRATVTYYESEKDARLDRPKTVPTTRYLRTVRCLNEYDVERVCRREQIPYADEFVLKFATTREEIRHVYVNGPRSCMSGDSEVRDYGFHSTEVYACDPVAVAYLVDKNDSEHIAARAVVNRDKKQWVTIYGCESQMRSHLEREGYNQSYGALRGAKLLRLSFKDQVNGYESFPLPYNDYSGSHEATSCGQFWNVI